MSKFDICILPLLFMAATLPNGLSQDQYLEKYEYGKSYEFTNRMSEQVWEEQKNQIREFLWECWKGRRSGYLDEKYRNLEGERTSVRFYIEACNSVDWCVVKFTRGEQHDRTPTGRTWRDTRCTTAITLKRFDKRSSRSGITVEIAKDEIRPPDSYLLRLYDKEGKLICEK